MFVLFQAWKKYKFQFWAFGDHSQCTAPVSGWIYYHKNPIWMEMCGNTMVKMQYKPDIGRYDSTLWQSLKMLQDRGRLDPSFKEDTPPLCYKHITATNAERHSVNKGCFERWIAEHDKTVVSIAGFRACVGLHVMVYQESKKESNLFKTQVWTIKKIDCKTRMVSLTMEEAEPLEIDFDTFRRLFDYAFATTAHKIQGVTIKEDYIIHETNKMSFNVLYTAMSRGVTRSKVHLTDVDWDLPYCLDTPQACERMTMDKMRIRKTLGRVYRITVASGRTYIGQTQQQLNELCRCDRHQVKWARMRSARMHMISPLTMNWGSGFVHAFQLRAADDHDAHDHVRGNAPPGPHAYACCTVSDTCARA